MIKRILIATVYILFFFTIYGQSEQKIIVENDYKVVSEQIKYLINDLIIENRSDLKQFSDPVLIKQYLTIQENEFVNTSHVSDYIRKKDSLISDPFTAIWAVYIVKVGKDSTHLSFNLEELLDKKGEILKLSNYSSNGKFEKEVINHVKQPQIDSAIESQEILPVSEVKDDELLVLKNHPIDHLIDSTGIIPFDTPINDVVRAIGYRPNDVYCDDCVDNKIQEWYFEPNTYFRIVHLKDGNILYYVYNFEKYIIKDLFFGFSLGETSQSDILDKFADYEVDIYTREIEGQGSTLENEIMDVDLGYCFAQFSFENGRLFSIMIAKEKL